MGTCHSGTGKAGGKALISIQTGVTNNFITPFNSQNDAASPYWVSSLKDAIGKEAFMRGYEITQQQVDTMADNIISKLPTAQEVRERFKRRNNNASQKKAAPNTYFTQAELNKMSRNKLESTALQVARKLASKQGISEAEAERRAKMLISSNSDAQLRKYIKRNG